MADWMRRYVMHDAEDLQANVHNIDGWEFVSDLRCLLATREASLAITRPAELLPQKHLHIARGILAEEPPDGARVTTLSDLWLWLDRIERVTCPACREDGRSDYCEGCDGDGWVWPSGSDADTVSFFGKPFDHCRLTWWLPADLGDPGQPVTYWLRQFEMGHALHLRGNSWRLVTMGLKPDMHPGVYREYIPGAGLWWAARRGGAFAGADWFCEHDLWDERQMWGDVPEPVEV